MKVIILAAGRGSRLNHLTDDKPKCMCKVNGRTILERCIETLEKSGFNRNDIIIVTGYKSEKIDIKDVIYLYNENYENTNMFISLTMADKYLKTEDCIIVYSDIIFSENAINELKNTKEDIAITYYTEFWKLWKLRFENPFDDIETFKINEKSYLTQIGLKTNDLNDIQGQYMGILKITPSIYEKILEITKKELPKPLEKLDMTTLLNEMIKNKINIFAIPTSDLWLECDTEEDIKIYEREFLEYL